MEAVLVDTGPIVALLDRSDRHHAACRGELASIKAPLFTVWPVITEAAYLLSTISARAQADFLEMLGTRAIQILSLGHEDLPRIGELLRKYADLPMDLADAALVRVAERENLSAIFTVDRKDFRIYRPIHIRSFRLLPA